MIFNVVAENLKNDESYKERNLYYKFFAGYFFNELISGYEDRKLHFFNLLESKISLPDRFFGESNNANTILTEMQTVPLNVTFDYHPAQIFEEDKKDNRGEMSDILVLTGKYMLSIECKFLSNINYKKDVNEVQERIIKFSNRFNKAALQILLLKKEKWNNSKLTRNNLNDKRPVIPIVVLFWEDLLVISNNKIVCNFLSIQLNR